MKSLLRHNPLTALFAVLAILSAFATAVRAEPNATSLKDCSLCPEMVMIQAGAFTMGRDGGRKNQAPAHKVVIAKSFALSKTEITFDQWAACVADGGCRMLEKDRGWGRGGRPVIYVDWQDAVSYAKWLSQKSGKTYRLPNEEEWEYAARGARSLPVSGAGIANCHKCEGKAERNTLPVGQFPANGYGLLDMLGNVMEWTASCWRAHYAAKKVDCDKRVRRGGSWYFNRAVSTPTYRYGARPGHKGYDIGFRVLRETK
jgi:formylglycine-generating enzyme required for sulfatase activity